MDWSISLSEMHAFAIRTLLILIVSAGSEQNFENPRAHVVLCDSWKRRRVGFMCDSCDLSAELLRWL